MAIVFSAKINGNSQDPYSNTNYYTGELRSGYMDQDTSHLHRIVHSPNILLHPLFDRRFHRHLQPHQTDSRILHILGRSHCRSLQPSLRCFCRYNRFHGRFSRCRRPPIVRQDFDCRGELVSDSPCAETLFLCFIKITPLFLGCLYGSMHARTDHQIFGSVLGLFGLIGKFLNALTLETS